MSRNRRKKEVTRKITLKKLTKLQITRYWTLTFIIKSDKIIYITKKIITFKQKPYKIIIRHTINIIEVMFTKVTLFEIFKWWNRRVKTLNRIETTI